MIKKKKVLTLGFSSAPKPEPISAEKKYFPVKAEEKGEANFSTSRKVTPFLLSLQRKTYLHTESFTLIFNKCSIFTLNSLSFLER